MIWALLTGPQIAQACLTTLVGIGIALVGYLLKRKVNEIHVLVNSQMTTALNRIAALETKLGLSPGEEIPHPAIVTSPTEGPSPSPAS